MIISVDAHCGENKAVAATTRESSPWGAQVAEELAAKGCRTYLQDGGGGSAQGGTDQLGRSLPWGGVAAQSELDLGLNRADRQRKLTRRGREMTSKASSLQGLGERRGERVAYWWCRSRQCLASRACAGKESKEWAGRKIQACQSSTISSVELMCRREH